MSRTLLAILAVLALPGPGRAGDGAIRRFAVVAGASLGGPGRVPLRYAVRDAQGMARVLRKLGGVALDDLVVLEEPDADRLRGALAAVATESERTRLGGGRVELFVYYSGHSDEGGLLLGASRLSYSDLRQELDRVPADVRVAILDSCSSGAITRTKGGTHRPPFLLDASSQVKGHAFLTSSAADEAAQESDRLRGSFFTHALLSGLRGAADASGDGMVTLNEAYQFAFRETLASTEAAQGGPQHATYDFSLVGSGDVVMTDLRRADAVLVFPAPLGGRAFVRTASGQLVAELRKVRGVRVELALEEGRYAVLIAQDRRALQGTFELVANQRVAVEEERLTSAALATTTSRGEGGRSGTEPADARSAVEDSELGDPARRSALSVRGGILERPSPGSLHGWGGTVALEEWLPDGVVRVELSAGFQRIQGAPSPLTNDALSIVPLAVSLKYGLPGRVVRPYLLAGASGALIRIVRSPIIGAERIGITERKETRFSAGLHAGAGMELRVDPRISLVLDGRWHQGSPILIDGEKIPLGQAQVTAGLSVTLP